MKKVILATIMLSILLGGVIRANASLDYFGTDIFTGNQIIVDYEHNLMWYDYTKAADTWQSQVSWADSLTVFTPFDIFDDWRLPSTVDGVYNWGTNGTTTAGYNITNSELGHLYYSELGNKGYCSTANDCPQTGYGLTNTGPFQKLLGTWYWSGTEYAADSAGAWNLDMSAGTQSNDYKTGEHSAIAVRSLFAVAPEPVSSTLFIIGAVTLGLRRFKKK